MDIPDILKIIIFEDFLKIAKKGPPQGPYWSLLMILKSFEDSEFFLHKKKIPCL